MGVPDHRTLLWKNKKQSSSVVQISREGLARHRGTPVYMVKFKVYILIPFMYKKGIYIGCLCVLYIEHFWKNMSETWQLLLLGKEIKGLDRFVCCLKGYFSNVGHVFFELKKQS